MSVNMRCGVERYLQLQMFCWVAETVGPVNTMEDVHRHATHCVGQNNSLSSRRYPEFLSHGVADTAMVKTKIDLPERTFRTLSLSLSRNLVFTGLIITCICNHAAH
jgi:hypothetical protein